MNDETDLRKLRLLLKNYGGIIKKKQLVPFKQPVIFFIRRHGEVEFLEGAKGEYYKYESTDGDIRTIYLTPSQNLLTFKYGGDTFKGYICHEDHPVPIPEDPIITLETFGMVIDKTLHDVKAWKAKEFLARGNMYVQIAIGIAILIGCVALYKLTFPTQPDPVIIQQVITNTTQGYVLG